LRPGVKSHTLSLGKFLSPAATFRPTKRIHGISARAGTPVDKAFVPGYVVVSVSTILVIAFSPPEDALRKH
jgi:hypothetical protein